MTIKLTTEIINGNEMFDGPFVECKCLALCNGYEIYSTEQGIASARVTFHSLRNSETLAHVGFIIQGPLQTFYFAKL